jgi:hypothetical protein
MQSKRSKPSSAASTQQSSGGEALAVFVNEEAINIASSLAQLLAQIEVQSSVANVLVSCSDMKKVEKQDQLHLALDQHSGNCIGPQELLGLAQVETHTSHTLTQTVFPAVEGALRKQKRHIRMIRELMLEVELQSSDSESSGSDTDIDEDHPYWHGHAHNNPVVDYTPADEALIDQVELESSGDEMEMFPSLAELQARR